MPTLPDKIQERFVELKVSGVPQSEAYRKAHAENGFILGDMSEQTLKNYASMLANMPLVSQRISELKAEKNSEILGMQLDSDMEVDDLVDEFAERVSQGMPVSLAYRVAFAANGTMKLSEAVGKNRGYALLKKTFVRALVERKRFERQQHGLPTRAATAQFIYDELYEMFQKQMGKIPYKTGELGDDGRPFEVFAPNFPQARETLKLLGQTLGLYDKQIVQITGPDGGPVVTRLELAFKELDAAVVAKVMKDEGLDGSTPITDNAPIDVQFTEEKQIADPTPSGG